MTTTCNFMGTNTTVRFCLSVWLGLIVTFFLITTAAPPLSCYTYRMLLSPNHVVWKYVKQRVMIHHHRLHFLSF